jgi:diguanylate cyclase (GGDEF)-like protein
MSDRHALLDSQIKRFLPDPASVPTELQPLLDAVDASYREFDADLGSREARSQLMRGIRVELESSMSQRTEELLKANEALTNEIAGRKRFEEQLIYYAEHDELTGAFNRRRLEDELEKKLREAEVDGSHGAVLFLDLDQFKDVNDSLGHRAGDELLKGLGDLLRACMRERDVLARIGGDEFAIVLPQTLPTQARAIAQRIEDTIRHHTFLIHRRPVNVTGSIGVALYPRHGATPEQLFSNADLAMYQAKAKGRSRVEILRPNRDWRSVSEARLSWRNRIVEALEMDKFALYAQPIRNLRGHDVEWEAGDYEILLRLPLPGGEIVAPGMFLDVAEEFGLVTDIDRWVMTQSMRIIAQQQRLGHSVRLAVNVSGKSFGSSELLALIRSQLASTEIDPANLVAEVTETAAIANIAQAQKFIRTLKGLGLRFSLDDFGSGFSSFSQLKNLPVDYLKIDGSFIKDLASSDVDQQLVQAMVAVANGLGKQTIAEFVGDQATIELLQGYGVDYAQGYFIGRPVDVHKALLDDAMQRAVAA